MHSSEHMSGAESQHSQISLFSGSEAGSSLELFSQPPNQAETAASCTSTDFSCDHDAENHPQPHNNMVNLSS